MRVFGVRRIAGIACEWAVWRPEQYVLGFNGG